MIGIVTGLKRKVCFQMGYATGFYVGTHVHLKFIVDNLISYFHVLSDEWA